MVGIIFGLGLAGTGLAYMLYYYIVENLGAVSASSATYIPPVVAVFIGYVFVQEPISLLDVTAMALILAGVFLLRAQK